MNAAGPIVSREEREITDAVLRLRLDAALRRILVDLERPVELDEWRVRPRLTPRDGAVSVRDKHGRDLRMRAA
jgi:hypothetical protein